MKKFLALMCLICCMTAYARDLNFDDHGNLIDPKLNKIYKVTRHYGYLFTSTGRSPLYEVTLFDLTTKWRLNLGVAYKMVYTDWSWSIKDRTVGIGLVTGYSFKKHQPTIGLAFTLRWL